MEWRKWYERDRPSPAYYVHTYQLQLLLFSSLSSVGPALVAFVYSVTNRYWDLPDVSETFRRRDNACPLRDVRKRKGKISFCCGNERKESKAIYTGTLQIHGPPLASAERPLHPLGKPWGY